MEKKTKFAIGCLVQWYEIDILHEYVNSLIPALKLYASPSDVIVDFTLVMNEQLEEYDGNYLDFLEIPNKFSETLKPLTDLCMLNYKTDYGLYTIADYRRNFNIFFKDTVDLLIWGETDMLAPGNMFYVLNEFHQNIRTFTSKYIVTFATCKMWDESWAPLEHERFTVKPFIENDYTNWWSLKYTMTQKEMDDINEAENSVNSKYIRPIKFNGCGLVISSEIIKAGVNIPESVFFVHEDSAFMKVLSTKLPLVAQYHFSNILLVHNRNHPQKRNYVKGETGDTLNKKRRSNDWYVKANMMSETNYKNLYSPGYNPFTWDDVFGNTNKN